MGRDPSATARLAHDGHLLLRCRRPACPVPERRARPAHRRVRALLDAEYRRPDDNAALAFAICAPTSSGFRASSTRRSARTTRSRATAFTLSCSSRRATSPTGSRARPLHVFFLPKTPEEARGVLAKLEARAALVVTDDFPSFVAPSRRRARPPRHVPRLRRRRQRGCPLALFPTDELGRAPCARTSASAGRMAQAPWSHAQGPAPPRLDLPFDPVRLDRPDPGPRRCCAIDHSVPPSRSSRAARSPPAARHGLRHEEARLLRRRLPRPVARRDERSVPLPALRHDQRAAGGAPGA